IRAGGSCTPSPHEYESERVNLIPGPPGRGKSWAGSGQDARYHHCPAGATRNDHVAHPHQKSTAAPITPYAALVTRKARRGVYQEGSLEGRVSGIATTTVQPGRRGRESERGTTAEHRAAYLQWRDLPRRVARGAARPDLRGFRADYLR